jgi:hypothetical protein
MKDLIQKFGLHKKEAKIILVVLLAIILVVLLFLNGVLKWPNASNKNSSVEKALDTGLSESSSELLEQNGDVEIKKTTPATVLVKMAFLADAQYKNIIPGKMAGCDIVTMVDRRVPNSPAILNVTLKELFVYKQELDYLPGNFVAKQDKLKFDKATIENGTAKIYLIGEIVYGGVCDNPRLTAQITETAKQFSSVKNVEIYLNGQIYKMPTGN